MAFGGFHSAHVCLDAPFTDKAVRIEPTLQGDYQDLKILLGEQGN